jgi:hypothetical protein
MKSTNYAALAIAASVSLVFVVALKPKGFEGAIFMAAWLLLPYAALALALACFSKERASEISYALATLAVAASGLLFLIDVIFLRPNPQGGLAFVLTPIYQAIGIPVLVPVFRWLRKRRAVALAAPSPYSPAARLEDGNPGQCSHTAVHTNGEDP